MRRVPAKRQISGRIDGWFSHVAIMKRLLMEPVDHPVSDGVRGLVGAIWVAGGLVTLGLCELSRVLGRVGSRPFHPGGLVDFLAWALVVIGAGLVLYALASKTRRPAGRDR